jgi:predicted TPR repeat methyltransferase
MDEKPNSFVQSEMLNTGERVAKFFDSFADGYESIATTSEYFLSAWIRRHVQDIQGLDPCEVLDLGCGTGLNVKLLCEQREGIRAVGVDVSSKMLEQSRAGNRYHKLYAHDLSKPLPDISAGSFDLVIAMSFLDYLPDVGACFSECHRVLKPNGTLWASVRRFEAEDEGSPPRHVSVQGIHVTGYSAGEMLYMISRAGLYVIGMEAVTGYITRSGFPCPYHVIRARKS